MPTDPHPQASELLDALRDAREALERVANAKALAGVRDLVGGWDGEGMEGGPYERHPARLGATLPKTDCGSVYELDEALVGANATLARLTKILGEHDGHDAG